MPSGEALRARVLALAPVVMVVMPWWQCDLMHPAREPDLIVPAPDRSPPVPPYRTGDRPETSPPAQRRTPPHLEPPPMLVRDDLVVAALERFRSSFTYCYRRAQRDDPSLGMLKVELRLYIDPSGMVMDAYTDLDDRPLATCLLNVARRMKFRPPKVMAMAYVALAW
jgi:hypothetical protein